VWWQDSGVQHVRICQDNVPAFPNRLSSVIRRVAIVGKHSKAVVEPLRKIMQFGELILGQGFGWKQVKGAGIGVLQHRVQHGQVVAEGLARCCRSHDDDVFSLVHQVGCNSLV